MKPALKLSDDKMCFACGKKNPRGLRLNFTVDAKRHSIATRWTPTKELQGYADIVHGGMIALVLDEMMVNLLWTLGYPAVTAQLATRFFRPAKIHELLDCEAHMEKEKGKLFRMKAQARTPAGTLIAQATATCIRVARPSKNG